MLKNDEEKRHIIEFKRDTLNKGKAGLVATLMLKPDDDVAVE